MPDFLVIGAGKSGTTSLDKYLNQHPQIFVPKIKEPNFFGYENTSVEDLKTPEDVAHFKRSVTTLPAYHEIFRDAAPGQIKGETSNTYMYHEGAAERIKHYIPNVKLIAILRQPSKRLYSRYLHLARENRVPTKSFEDCMNKASIWWQRNDLIKEGYYYQYLKKYYDLFPKENIKVYLYDDFLKRSGEIMEEIYTFIGVDPTFKPDQSIRYNESGIIKNKFLNSIIGQGGVLSKVSQVLPANLASKLKTSLSLKKRINNLRGKNLAKPDMNPDINAFLTNDVYQEDIKNLSKLLNRDLSHWLDVKAKN